MGYLQRIVKQANTTYSYSAALDRNYNPKPTEKPIRVNENTGTNTYNVTTKPWSMPGTPPKSANVPMTAPWYSEFSFLHPFTPTVSGTGSGHKYWQEPRNPFDV